jgi:hypothetical protein
MAALASASPMVIFWVICWLAGGILVLRSVARGRAVAQAAGVALIALAGTLLWYGFLNPALANEITLKSFADVVDHKVPDDLPVDYIGPFDCDVAFYSQHEISSLNKFQCGAQSQDQYFLVWQDRLAAMTPEQRACLTPAAQSSAVDRHGIRVLMVEKK